MQQTTTLLSWRNCEPNSKVVVTWFEQRNDDICHAPPPPFSSLTWWPRRCATGEAWPNIMLSCQAGRPCDVRAHRNRLTTWSPHVSTRYFGFFLMQHYYTGKHSYSHVFCGCVDHFFDMAFIYWFNWLTKCFHGFTWYKRTEILYFWQFISDTPLLTTYWVGDFWLDSFL